MRTQLVNPHPNQKKTKHKKKKKTKEEEEEEEEDQKKPNRHTINRFSGEGKKEGGENTILLQNRGK